jgi:hypothetical protein
VEGARGEVGQHRSTWEAILEAIVGSEANGGGLSACVCSKRWMADDISLLRGDTWRSAAQCRGTTRGGEAGDLRWLLRWLAWWSVQ